MRRKRLAGLMVCVMLFSLFPANALAAEGDGIPVNRAVSLPDSETELSAPTWETSKSKTATNLEKNAEGNYTSRVTLSLPSAGEQLVSDVVLVLDKSSSAYAENQALEMLKSLNLKKMMDKSLQTEIFICVALFCLGWNR